MTTQCPLCRQQVEEREGNPLPSHPCRLPVTEAEMKVAWYLSIGRGLHHAQFGVWPPVEAWCYEQCLPSSPPLSDVQDPSQP